MLYWTITLNILKNVTKQIYETHMEHTESIHGKPIFFKEHMDTEMSENMGLIIMP